MVFNTTFNNISVISWRSVTIFQLYHGGQLQYFSYIMAVSYNISGISWQSVLLVEETGVPRENHRPVVSH